MKYKPQHTQPVWMGFNYYANLFVVMRGAMFTGIGRHETRVGYWELEIRCTELFSNE